MLQFINNLPDHVVGILATGEVTKEDYQKVLAPRINELSKTNEKINYLAILETELQNFTMSAWLEDLKLGIKNFGNWNKIAVVTDQKGVEWLTDVSNHFIPGEAKGFKLSEVDDAIRWVSSGGEEKHELGEVTIEDVKEEIHRRTSNTGQGPAVEDL